MRARPYLTAFVLALALAGCVGQGHLTALTYTNPVLDADFPDPALMRAPDGFHYAYATQGGEAGMRNIQIARSADLVHWDLLPDALPVKPVWAAATQDFWAPHVTRFGRRYHLYYSAKPDKALADPRAGLCLAVATSDRPQGPFIDSGRPLLCGAGFASIDPFVFDDPQTGRRLLYWGSGFEPIKVQPLAPDGLGFAPGSKAIALVAPVPGSGPANYRRLVEGAWVILHDGWYYLFFSGDNCCGPDAHYAVMVARSRHATGPFHTRAAGEGDSVILRAGGPWNAPGHNSVVQDATGVWWMVYHAVDRRTPSATSAAAPSSRRVMLVDRLVWRDGWPAVAGGTPSRTPQAVPATD